MASQTADIQKAALVPATAEDITKLNKLIKEVRTCMFTTTDAEEHLHSRPMSVNGELEQAADGHAVVWFFTYGNSHKCKELHQHGHKCNLAFSHPGNQTYLSVSGTATLMRDRAEMEKRWNPTLKAWFPKGLDEPDAALLKVTILKAEYWDAPSSVVARAISFAKGQLTGTPADAAAHKKIVVEGATTGTGTTTKQEHKAQGRAEEGKLA